MSLKATLTGQQIKYLKIALQCLGRIGSELLIEGFPERVVLRSINSSKSAYASVSFHSNFFDEYNVFERNIVQAGVLMKHVLTVFRTQRISRLEKRYTVPCLEAEILQATVDKDMFPIYLLAEAAELSRLLSSFHTTVGEITIIATPDCEADPGQASKTVQMRSFNDPAKAHADKALYTQLSLDTREVFLQYQHSTDAVSDVTFNLKDFKHMLSMCESLGASVAIRFDQPGAPLVVEPHFTGNHEIECEAELVLATLMESQQAEPLSQQPQPGPAGGQLGAAPNSVVPGDTPYGARGGRTPGTALHGNMRTPATGARQTPASNSGRPAQNPLNTVAAATTRPSRFMQGAARGGRPADQQAAPDDTPVVPARPASDAGTDASNKGPTSGETFNPSPAWQVQRRFRPRGQAAGLGQASTVGQPPGRHQRQDMADVSIAGSEAGPSGRQAMPDEDPSLYTHRSNRLAHSMPTAAPAQPTHLLWLPTARLGHLSSVM
ncbi:MAG: cell cycle checkpoint control RAD9A-like [Trebouxia sp. A1-2]|nr:MAG: cell cycle checkpoint control RAD9A-like [Trebouxia sp. A1-2]